MTRVVDLSFRADAAGGDVADATFSEQGQPITVDRLQGDGHLIVLLHGFNVSLADGQKSYGLLLDRLASLAPPGRDWAFGATVLRVFWPGDANWGIFSAAAYPSAIPKANDCGHRLALLLDELSRYSPPELLVDLLGHSMGNRVALQTFNDLAGNGRVRLRRGLHMAAAVSIWQLEDGQQAMHGGLQRGLQGFGVTSVHSAGDMVLSVAFPVGESLKSSTQGFMPVALGHQHWSAGDGLNGLLQVTRDSLGHGDYWGKLDTQLIHDALDLSPSVARQLTRAVLTQADALVYQGPPSRDTPSRTAGDGLLA